MALVFDTSTGVTSEETATIRARLASQWKEAFNVSEGTPELNTDPETPAGQLIDGQAALISEKDGELLELANGFNPSTVTGIFQDALAQIYFISRQVAQPTYVTCQCKGLQGTVIPYGAVVQDVNGYNFYNTLTGKINETGVYESVFRCAVYGAVEVGAESVTRIITVIPGWDSVNNETAGVTGRDKETQSEFEQRRYDSVSKNAHGTAEAVQGTVANLDGVIAAKCEQNRGDVEITSHGVTIPPHSIYLSVYGGEPQDIGQAIHEKLGGGCGFTGNTRVIITDATNGSAHTYYYEIPEAEAVSMRVSMVKTSSTAETYEDDIKEALLTNFEGGTSAYSRVVMGQTIYASRFYADVIAAGISRLTSIEIKLGDGSYGDVIEIPLDKMPTLSADDIELVVTEET